MPHVFGSTLLIVNPVAQSGRAMKASEIVEAELGRDLHDLTVVYTKSTEHAIELGRTCSDYDTVLALGGDGLLHNVVAGMMEIADPLRPVFGVIPFGSGNDYARSLKISEKPSEAIRQLLSAEVQKVDVGMVNGNPFLQTLSFGVDAGIALGTMELRKKAGESGTILYLKSGIDQILHHFNDYEFRAELYGVPPVSPYPNNDKEIFDGKKDECVVQGRSLIFAVQIGQSYGGGFYICPHARIDNGIFDICIGRPPLTRLQGLGILLKAKESNHIHHHAIEFHRAKSLRVMFAKQPPAQMDGEPLVDTEFNISLLPKALTVLKP